MGNHQSVAQVVQKSIVMPPPPPPPPSIDVQREQMRVELNMAKADVKSKQAAYDNLDPLGAVNRKTDDGIKEATAYTNGVESRFNYEKKLYETTYSEIQTLANSPSYTLAQKYKQDLSKKLKDLENENLKFKEKASINRRRFLEANPHESVEGILGFNSLDDRIFLLFWVCFLIFIFPVSYYIIHSLGSKIGDSNTQTMIWLSSIIILCIFTHLLLKNFV